MIRCLPLLCLSLFGAVAVQGQDLPEPGKFISRTMALLKSATPEHRTPVYILCYGQSIIANSGIDHVLLGYLTKQFPNADIKIQNLAIGGYEAPVLRKTCWADLYPKNPDLVLFHVYGGEKGGELEEIYRGIRMNMTAEMMTWTHHVDNFNAGMDKQRDESSEFIKQLATRYQFEVADARPRWKEYLAQNHLPAQALLKDQIHLNPKGTALLEQILEPHFVTDQAAPDNWKKKVCTVELGERSDQVKFYAKSWSRKDGGLVSTGTIPLRITFHGNRLDLVALSGSGVRPGSAKITLDGMQPSKDPDTVYASRPTLAPMVWWPMFNRIKLSDKAVVEKYTANFHDVSPDGLTYTYDLQGSVSGAEGSGHSGADFTSNSGRVSIAAADIDLPKIKKVTKKDLPPQFTATWYNFSMSKDTWHPRVATKPGEVLQDTVVRCWKDGPHTVEITPVGDGPIALGQAMIFSPAGDAGNSEGAAK